MAVKGTYIYDWPRPMVTADALVFRRGLNSLQVLLVKRAHPPFEARWAIPGGFVDMDEELHDAALRELAEETGLTGIELEQMHTFGAVGRDPRGRQITVCFLGLADDDCPPLKAGDDAAEARWWDVNALPQPLAFDHADVIAMGLARLAHEKT